MGISTTGETLRLRDVMDRTGFAKGMCFRLLYTLRHCGFIEKVENNRYRLTGEIRRRKKYRIGYAARARTARSRRSPQGLVRAAERAQIELIVVDNRYQPKVALKNAELLIREGVDLVVEFQTDESVAPAIASAYHQARIPMIAIDIPHPGATYFGANNYEAGLLAGRQLARWAKQHWGGTSTRCCCSSWRAPGRCPRAHARRGRRHREVLHDAAEWRVVSIDGDGQFKTSLERVRRHLREIRRGGSWSAPPTTRARSARRGRSRRRAAAIVRDRRAERRTARAGGAARRARPLIASVGYFPSGTAKG